MWIEKSLLGNNAIGLRGTTSGFYPSGHNFVNQKFRERS